MDRRIVGFMMGLLCCSVVYADEGNANHGALLYIQKACITCHGANGRGGVPTSPIIGGQKYPYLVNSLLDYRKGYRKNEIMQPVSALLSDSDIRDLSAYLTSKK